ncbi:MAG: dihydropteroate synthase [Gammaproteobacteria bacterium]|mgnify:CR=1 FL=1|nr:dihydropteroate synthase [Gammaproteobacteria bacterium]
MSAILQCGKHQLDLSRPHIMGILNITPDSFSDGGQYNTLDAALHRAGNMLEAGASLLDVGGESTRPGAKAVSPQQELDRVAPLVEALVKNFDCIVSVDSSTPQVMTESAALGAGLLNDVRALQREGALEAAAQTGLPVCLMHMRGEPQTMQDAPHYDDVAAEVAAFLQQRVDACVVAGISRERIVLDPGFGFAKTLQHNLELFSRLPELHALNLPLLVGVSRKSMVGSVLDKPVDQRLYGSLALAVMALERGGKIIRVHDVAQTMDALKMFEAVQTGWREYQ